MRRRGLNLRETKSAQHLFYHPRDLTQGKRHPGTDERPAPGMPSFMNWKLPASDSVACSEEEAK
jgi:hypothetical protein